MKSIWVHVSRRHRVLPYRLFQHVSVRFQHRRCGVQMAPNAGILSTAVSGQSAEDHAGCRGCLRRAYNHLAHLVQRRPTAAVTSSQHI